MLSQRIQNLRERQRETTPTICLERTRMVTDFSQQFSNLPMVLRHAEFFKHFLENKTIFIDDDAVLVGNLGSRPVSCPIFPDVISWLGDEIEELDTRSADPYLFLPGEKEELKKIAALWKGHTFGDFTRHQIGTDAALMEEVCAITIGSVEKNGIQCAGL